MFHNSEHSRVERNKQFKHAPLQLTNIYLLVGNELLNIATKYMWKKWQHLKRFCGKNSWRHSETNWIGVWLIWPDNLQHCLMGVMVPDEEVMVGWAKKNGRSTDMKEMCKSEVSIVIMGAEMRGVDQFFCTCQCHYLLIIMSPGKQSGTYIFTMVTYFLRWTLLKFFSSFPDEQSQQKVRQLDRITAQWLIHQMKLRARYCGYFEFIIFLWEF